ncbi:restriction endonuclease subunit S, partial [Oleidesulfovibrio alaskensis]
MNWKSVAIKDVAKVITGKTPARSNPDNFSGNIPFVTPTELGGDEYITNSKQNISPTAVNQSKIASANSILVCCIGSLGKIGIAGKDVAINQQINAVTFDEKSVYHKYGFYALRRLKPTLELMAPATTIPIVNKSKFEALRIP